VRVAASVSACAVAAMLAILGGCGTGGYVDGGSQGAGRQLFMDGQCEGCHTLADAGSNSTIGPNLDDAFAQARKDGMTTDTFRQVVAGQVKYPITETSTGGPGMPDVNTTLPHCDDVEGNAFCVEDQDQAVADVAAYVAAVAGTGRTPPEEEGPGPTDGASIFADNCGTCHTLSAAGTNGTIGPNLDETRPSKELAVQRVTNGIGVMPSFRDTLDPEQIDAVAEYVAANAGK
jgi:mono/diheme cytochrome c family protein